MSTAHIKEWQRILVDKGYDLGKYGVDGKFGEKTLKACKQAIGIAENDYVLKEGNFPIYEFICKDGTDVPMELMSNLKKLIGVLEIVRHKTGDIPLNIVSGYRTQGYNDKIYGKKNTNSMHILAGAADIESEIGVHSLGKICKELYDTNLIGGLGLGKNMIHIDIRNDTEITYKNKKAIWFYDGIQSYKDWLKITS